MISRTGMITEDNTAMVRISITAQAALRRFFVRVAARTSVGKLFIDCSSVDLTVVSFGLNSCGQKLAWAELSAPPLRSRRLCVELTVTGKSTAESPCSYA